MHIYFSPKQQNHAPTYVVPDYPQAYLEISARSESILTALVAAQIGRVMAPIDLGLSPIFACHAPELVHFLEAASGSRCNGVGQMLPLLPDTFAVGGIQHKPASVMGKFGQFAFDTACPIYSGTWQAAYWSAQAALGAARDVYENGGASYALCRPPGHHAGRDFFGGYCYLNNAAIAARWLQTESKGRVAILDIDYHHGNGTQQIFYADPAILYTSLHAHPDHEYPYFWGSLQETGADTAVGLTRNWPLPPGTDDEAYLAALAEALTSIETFLPDYLLISVGFDFMAGDPAPNKPGFQITPRGLAEIGRRIAACNLPTVIIQEGGYQLENLGMYAKIFLGHFMD